MEKVLAVAVTVENLLLMQWAEADGTRLVKFQPLNGEMRITVMA
jgi:hypothetical protein